MNVAKLREFVFLVIIVIALVAITLGTDFAFREKIAQVLGRYVWISDVLFLGFLLTVVLFYALLFS